MHEVQNKRATFFQNSAHRLTDWLTGVKCRATLVAKKSKGVGDGRIGASGGKTFVKVCQVMSAVVCHPSPMATSPHLKRSCKLGKLFQYWGPF